MTRVLIFGASGMLGHRLWRECKDRFDAFGTVRGRAGSLPDGGGGEDDRIVGGVSAEELESVDSAIARTSPQVAVNCIGIVKQSEAARRAAGMVEVNSLFPQHLAGICGTRGVRLIHISTDCVFSGRQGGYDELDLPDPADLYGRSKLAGEPESPGALNLRTSMIGWELTTRNGLLEWFASQEEGAVTGFRHAVFSGPTVPEVARLIAKIAEAHPKLAGTYHVGAAPISKYELLVKIRDALGLRVEIEPADEPRIDRSLDSSKLRDAVGWTAPSWDEMVAELARERRPA
jgi:dTDP-4-dehydrorhamnose reductase